MSKNSCENCGKVFNSRSNYNQHKNRKTPCINESIIEKIVEEKVKKQLNILQNTSNDEKNIINTSFESLKNYYNNTLNLDKSTYKSSNDEPTPIECIEEMMEKIPEELWTRKDLKILDPCCGNGNFHLPIYNKLAKIYDKKVILEHILEFNDTNKDRLENVRNIFNSNNYSLKIYNEDYLKHETNTRYDLIVANPPYAKILENGKRASKNHNLIKDFIDKSLGLLKADGYIMFITPDNWMSYADRNILIEKLTSLQIIHLDIHSAKKYFKKIGSSFTWYIIQNSQSYKNIEISGLWKKNNYTSSVISQKRKYIPLLYNKEVQSILSNTVDNKDLEKFHVKTSSDLHKYTKSQFIQSFQDDTYKYKLIHTPKQTVYASRPHKFQEGYKVFISTTDKYKVFVDNCGMTQSIVFIMCKTKEQAEKYKTILEHPLYVFINNICRWGNFNNIRILQSFPIPNIDYDGDHKKIFNYFKINEDEINYIYSNL